MSTQELDLDAVAEELTARRFGSKPPVAEAMPQETPSQPPRDYLDDIADMLTKERLVGGEIGQDIGNYPQAPIAPVQTVPPVPQPTVVEQPGMVGGDIGQVIGRDYSKLPQPIPQYSGGPSMMIGAGPSQQTMTGEFRLHLPPLDRNPR